MSDRKRDGKRQYRMQARARSVEETRLSILEAVEGAFEEIPFGEITLAAIAERSGVSVQTVLRHFENKDAMFMASLMHTASKMAADRDMQPSGSLEEIVDGLVDHYDNFGDRLLRMLAQEEREPTLRQLADLGRLFHLEWCKQAFSSTLENLQGAADRPVRRRHRHLYVEAAAAGPETQLKADQAGDEGAARAVDEGLTLSRILAYTAPARGHLYPLVPVLDELHRRGHEVALRTLAGEVEAMRSRGFAAAPIAAEIEALELDDWRAKTVAGAQMRALGTFCARAPHESRDLLQALEETRPDAAIVDILAWGALSTAEAWNGPWACYCHFPLPLPSPVGPPPGPGLAPAHGPLGRARDVAVRSFSELGFRRFVAPRLRETRRDLGLPPVRNSKEMLSAAPLHLYMSEEPFEYPRPEWPESVVKVGPCAWEPPGEFPSALADVGEPLVLVTTSSDFQDDGRLVKVALAGLAGEPLHVVATSAAANLRDVSIPSNATVLGFAPHSPILARAACAITHGGMGATQKALALGVPVCAVPFGRDQLEVARRVEVASAGTRLPASHLTPRRLRLKVEEAIACKPGAELIAKAFAEAGGAPLAADRIEQRLL